MKRGWGGGPGRPERRGRPGAPKGVWMASLALLGCGFVLLGPPAAAVGVGLEGVWAVLAGGGAVPGGPELVRTGAEAGPPGAENLSARTGGGEPAALAAADTDPQAVAHLPEQEPFPHLDHEGLFPLCTGCHGGIPEGEVAEAYPDPELCAGCHDGVELEEVEWAPPEVDARPDLLGFSHPEHIQEVAAEGEPDLSCQRCHAPPGASRMTVEPLEAQRCLTCHVHEAPDHYTEAECGTCHITLAESQLPVTRIASLPEPPGHDAPGFLLELHGVEALEETARCTTCHTQETCTSCHVAGAEETIARIPQAPPTLELPVREVAYPVPPSHLQPDFEVEHGMLVGEQSCATCHTRDSCASCHLPPLPEGARDLPERRSVQAPGVVLDAQAPASHASPFFMEDHTSLAAADPQSCASCHTRPFCTQCHEAAARPEFHPPNYIARHAADAWGATSECAACHQVQVSCRACHAEAGLTQTGRLGPGYHDAEPLWLLRHGQAARQSLESCASCHTQRECLQCHSQIGAFQVNPHGPDFDARRAWERNPVVCRACHIGDPLGGGGP